jgi:hypothetical protein
MEQHAWSPMADNFKYDVFLSYSSKDKAIVRTVAERLRKDGLRVWFDDWEIRPGDSIPHQIEEGLEHSRVLVLCMSAHAFGSDWAQLESYTFRFRDPLNKERRFIPLRLDDAPIKGSLAQFFYINWLPENSEYEYVRLLEGCGPPVMRRDVAPTGVSVDMAAADADSLSLLQREFQTRSDDYVALMHVKLDWLEGSSDPTRMKFKKVAGHGVSEEVFLKGGEDCSLFAGVHLSPEFWLSSWFDTEHNRFYPNRMCKHWVTIRDGSVDDAISTWKHFKSMANRAGEVIQRLGLRAEISDPLQRWLIVCHDTIKPDRITVPTIDKYNVSHPLPDTVRIGDMQIIQDWVGCSVIVDVHEASSATCKILTQRFIGENPAEPR